MTTIRYITSMFLVVLATASLFTVGRSLAEGDLGDGVSVPQGNCSQSITSYDSLSDQQMRDLFPD